MRTHPKLTFAITLVALASTATAMVPADLYDMRTCGIGDLSPDGTLLIYHVDIYDRSANQTQPTVYLRDLESGEERVVFSAEDRARGFRFSPDGNKVVFQRETDEGTEVWLMAADGSGRRLVAGPGSYGGFVWSPDGAALAHIVHDADTGYDGVPGVVTVADDLGWRHLSRGEREGAIGRLHVLDPVTGENTPVTTLDLDVREVAWSPDATRLVISAKSRPDLGRTLNTDLYVVERDGHATRRLSDNPGPDEHPIWLTDNTIACQSHRDPLHESEPAQIVIRDADSGRESLRLLDGFENCVWGTWRHGGRFYFRGANRGTVAIFAVAEDGPMQLTPQGWNCWDVRFGGSRAVIWANSQTSPGELMVIDLETGQVDPLVDPNERWLARVGLVEPQRFEVDVDGRVVEGWAYLPEGYQPGAGAQTVLSIHGGPEWMYGGYFLPEFHVLPTFGYVVLAANPTGSTGYGRAFMDDIQGDWTGRPARELMAVIDHAVAEGWADPDLLAVMGGSYGGHLAAALTTRTDRFAAAACDRMYPQTSAFWGATDEKWFPEWEFGGRPFDPEAREIYERNDPFPQVGHVTTPTLLSHGLRDFRCPQDGTVGWFSALRSLGVPARLLRFPGEAHGIRGRANQVFYLDQLLAWFERWVLNGDEHE